MAEIDVKAIAEQVKSDLQKEFEAQFQTQYSEKFKEEFGVTPEQFREKLAKERTANYQKVVALFSETMKKKHNLAPAVVDGFMVPLAMQFQDNPAVITFSENQKGSGLEVLEKFGESLAKLAKENQIVVDFSEQTRHSGIDGNPNLKNNSLNIDFKMMSEAEGAELDKKVVKYQRENKIEKYEDALEQYLELNG